MRSSRDFLHVFITAFRANLNVVFLNCFVLNVLLVSRHLFRVCKQNTDIGTFHMIDCGSTLICPLMYGWNGGRRVTADRFYFWHPTCELDPDDAQWRTSYGSLFRSTERRQRPLGVRSYDLWTTTHTPLIITVIALLNLMKLPLNGPDMLQCCQLTQSH